MPVQVRRFMGCNAGCTGGRRGGGGRGTGARAGNVGAVADRLEYRSGFGLNFRLRERTIATQPLAASQGPGRRMP